MQTNVTGYLKISNKGEIETGAFSLIGASTKRGDSSKIGFFGSGLKYALAVFLREGIPVSVFSGKKEVKITTKKSSFRDEQFDVICINGKPTSLTVQMGPSWKPWFAIREVYCNAIDETLIDIKLAGEPAGEEDITSFFVGITPKTKEVLEKWDHYFSDKRTDVVHRGLDVKFFHGSETTIIYRKGIQCFTSEKASLYHYDCEHLRINESRVLANDIEWKLSVGSYFVRHATRKMVENFLLNHKGKFEANFLWEYQTPNFTDRWLEAIDKRVLVPEEYAGNFIDEIKGLRYVILPYELIKVLKKAFDDKVDLIGEINDDGEKFRDPNDRERVYIDEAKEFLKAAGIPIEHNVRICSFRNSVMLGRAKEEEILLSPKLFDMGKKMVVMVMLEEESHLTTGYGDNTRGFQDYLFGKIVTLMEQKLNKFL